MKRKSELLKGKSLDEYMDQLMKEVDGELDTMMNYTSYLMNQI
jgi:hypothetical protein